MCYMYHMRSIGIRELRQHASRHLRSVQAGETIEVTDRGRPVARLVPVPSQRGLRGLIASERLTPAAGRLLDLPSPLPAKPGRPLPAEELERLRTDER